MIRGGVLLVAALGATLAGMPAGARETSLRPVARPMLVAAMQSLRPQLRPELHPVGRPEPAMSKRPRAGAGGGLCGDPALRGAQVGFVPGRIDGCGIADAVELSAVQGVSLTQAAVIDCGTARALSDWVKTSALPAFKGMNGGLVRLRVAAHYACRTRNNQPGGRISEHGKGRAIDISGFVLSDGREVTVLRDWGQGAAGRALAKVHRGACGPFGTVLGPGSDRFHQDHFHFDTAQYRSGPYCR